MGKVKDLTGASFGLLVVVGQATEKTHGHVCWICKCGCGSTTVVGGQHLRSGHTKSCGCLQREISKEQGTTHGGRQTRLYNVWCKMIQRCENPNHIRYDRYGGRGITICDEWREDFAAFRDWALANGYQDNLTIERENVNGNYEPSNCKWIPREEQPKNRCKPTKKSR